VKLLKKIKAIIKAWLRPLEQEVDQPYGCGGWGCCNINGRRGKCVSVLLAVFLLHLLAVAPSPTIFY